MRKCYKNSDVVLELYFILSYVNLQRLIGLYSKIFDDLGHLNKLR